MSRKDDIKKLIANYERRLQKLREQQSLQGISVDPKILIEIEDIKAEIDELRTDLKTLESNGGDSDISEKSQRAGAIAMTTFNQEGQTVHGNQYNAAGDQQIHHGDNITIGDVTNSNLNLKSTLTNVTQRIKQIPQADEATKQELATLLQKLLTELEKAPADKADDVELIAEDAQTLIELAADPQANPKKVQRTANNLKRAAEDIKEVMPTVLVIASQIVRTVLELPQFLA